MPVFSKPLPLPPPIYVYSPTANSAWPSGNQQPTSPTGTWVTHLPLRCASSYRYGIIPLDHEEREDILRHSTATRRNMAADSDLYELMVLADGGLISRDEVSNIIETRLHDIMQPFHTSGPFILRLLREFSMVIGGSVPQLLLHPLEFVPNDVDLFTETEHVNEIIGRLVALGYEVLTRPYFEPAAEHGPKERYPGRTEAFSAIYRLAHPGTTDRPGIKYFNIIVSKGRPILAVLASYSTILATYIAAHGVVIPYPLTSLRKKAILNLTTSLAEAPQFVQKGVEKYRERGWEFFYSHQAVLNGQDHICGSDPYCSQSFRSLYDQEVLHVPFPPVNNDTQLEAPGQRRQRLLQDDAHWAVWKLAGSANCVVPIEFGTPDCSMVAVDDVMYRGPSVRIYSSPVSAMHRGSGSGSVLL